MSTVFSQLTTAYDKALDAYESLANYDYSFETHDLFGDGINEIAYGDNIRYMLYLLHNKSMTGKLQLVYIDPPFFSKEKYMSTMKLNSAILGESPVIKVGAYDDYSKGTLEDYLSDLALRLMVIRDLVSDSGLIWVHLDRRVTHYIRLIMDMIFGQDNFVNEIIWNYKSGGASTRSFARKHDNLLVYSKSSKYKFNAIKEKSYNRGLKPYHFKGVEEFQDDNGWYTMVNMKDVWQLDMVGRTSAERQGYATQKPESLMERIIKSCSDECDICADFYGGSGAFAAVCQKLGRYWLTCDNNPASVVGQIDRLSNIGSQFRVIKDGIWPKGEATVLNGEITDYKASLDEIKSNKIDILKEYMHKDGKSLLRLVRTVKEGDKSYISGYDFLGNWFKKGVD